MEYYFEVLPFHPKPKPGESFTSYLSRLAELNHLTTYYDISQLINCSYKTRKREIEENITMKEGDFCVKAHLGIGEFQSLSFFNLQQRFGRTTTPQAISSFLRDSVSTSIKYCPYCLREDNYYRLSWRFNEISSCVHHECSLVEACSSCGKPIPIFSQPFKIGFCPNCGNDLRISNPNQADVNSIARSKELEVFVNFLTKKNEFPNKKPYRNLADVFGDLFIESRSSRFISRAEAARTIGIKESTLLNAELGCSGRTNFSSYINISRLLQIPLHMIMDRYSLLNGSNVPVILLEKRGVTQLQYTSFIEIQKMLSHNEEINISILAQRVGVHESILFEDNWIRRLLRQYTKVDQNQIEVTICKSIEVNWGIITKLDKCPTNSTILKMLGCSEVYSKNCPKVSELIQQKRKASFPKIPRKYKPQVNIESVLCRLRQSEDKIKVEYINKNRFLTKKNICDLLGVSDSIIRGHQILNVEISNIVDYVHQQIINNRNYRAPGEAVYTQVLDFLIKRKMVNPKITRKELSEEIGISGRRLRSYPRVKELLVFALKRQKPRGVYKIRELEGYHANNF
jgi:hypothetical protein